MTGAGDEVAAEGIGSENGVVGAGPEWMRSREPENRGWLESEARTNS